MLTSLRIQNFRSIRDASVKLGQVNLFIGPNNSGKSNFLKGIELLAEQQFEPYSPKDYETDLFGKLLFRKAGKFDNDLKGIPYGERIEFDVLANRGNFEFSYALRMQQELSKPSFPFSPYVVKPTLMTPDSEDKQEVSYQQEVLSHQMHQVFIYKVQPTLFQGSSALSSASKIAADGSNLVQFLFYLSQNYKSVFHRLENDLARCVGNLVAISTPADPSEPGKLKLKFFDKNDIGYWAEEVSEGVLYFLALLCIVHQPDPPKLLLLEEPEKGIHPRRIKEVMDFIFELARLRDIQIILTSHSPYVVDHFADIPECISVFDREEGETVIRNAADIMAETNAALAAGGQPPIRYSDGLGEHWVSGFLGGVPL